MKIPLSRKSLVHSDHSPVYMTGAPSMSFKMDEADAVKSLGKSIGSAASQLGGSMLQYARESRDAEDRLAATEARSLYRTIQANLATRMTENPNDFEHFAEWASDAEQEYNNSVKPVTDRMSSRCRKLFEAEMQGIRAETANQRTRVGLQAKISADYKLFQSQWKDASLRGDEAEASRILNEHRGKLISEQEYQQKLLDFNRLRDSGAAKRLVETSPAAAVEQLKARTPDGSYSNFPKLDLSYRERLIHTAETTTAKRELETMQSFNAGLISGDNQITQEQLDAQHKSGEINDRLYVSMSANLKSYLAEKVRVQDRNASAAQKAKDRADAISQSKFKLLVREFEFSSDPARNILEKNTFLKQLQKDFKGQYKFQTEMLDYLEERSKLVGLKRRIFATPEGETCKKWLDDNYSERFFRYDPPGLGNKEQSEEFARSRYIEASDYLAQCLKQGLPAAEAIKRTEDLIQRLNDGQIYHLYKNGTVGSPKKTVYDSRNTRGFFPNRGDLDLADVVEKSVEKSSGREIWKLKNGSVVFADEFSPAPQPPSFFISGGR